MKKEIENIELRSEEVQEILGHIPSKIVRYGITAMSVIMLILFVGSFIFKYPDVIEAPFVLVTENPPAQITAKSNGNIHQLLVEDNQQVHSNDFLAIIQNPADSYHVKFLADQLPKIKKQLFSNELFSLITDTLLLGEIQSAWSLFAKSAYDYKQFSMLDYYVEKLDALEGKQKQLDYFIALLEEQTKLKRKTLILSESQYARDSQLYSNEVISLADLEDSKKNLIQDGLAVQLALSVIVTNTIAWQDIEQQIIELKMDKQRDEENLKQRLSEQLYYLESRLAWWYDSYLLTTPIEGKVSFNSVWSENQYVRVGQQVFTIVPEGMQQIIGRVILPSKGAGKVKAGQTVNLKFNGYPYQEFGIVQAKVEKVSLVPINEEYILELLLSDTLITNYGNEIPFKQNMAGVVEIITEELPLIARIFNPLKAILKKHT